MSTQNRLPQTQQQQLSIATVVGLPELPLDFVPQDVLCQPLSSNGPLKQGEGGFEWNRYLPESRRRMPSVRATISCGNTKCRTS